MTKKTFPAERRRLAEKYPQYFNKAVSNFKRGIVSLPINLVPFKNRPKPKSKRSLVPSPTKNMKFTLIEPVSLSDYIPIIKDVYFDNISSQRCFVATCATYVGLIEDEEISGVWQQRIAYSGDHYHRVPVGITGWYSHPPFDLPRIWLGWFGVRKEFQGKKYGSLLLMDTIDAIKSDVVGIDELFVFTDTGAGFYQKCGFEKLGSIGELCKKKYPGIDKDTGFNLNEIVLMKKI